MGNEKKLISSIAPSAYQSTAEMMREVLRLHDIDVGTAKPAIVEKFNRDTGSAQVRLLVQDVFASQDGDVYKDVASIVVPVLRLQHGMFWVEAPLYPGDTGYVVAGHRDGSLAVDGNSKPVLEPKRDANGRDIEARTNNSGPQPPNTYLLHRYENGFFVPCRWGVVSVEEKDRDALVIARLKEDAEKAKLGIYETDGTEGKIVLEKSGAVRIDGKTDASTQSRSVHIDPTRDLARTDARFREAIILSQEVDAETGKVSFRYKRHRVMADEGEDVTGSTVAGGGIGGGNDAFFSIYAKDDGTYTMRKGMACVDNDQFLDVAAPEEALDPTKEYYCCVRVATESGVLAGAEIVSFDKVEAQKEGEKDEDYEKRRIEKMQEQFAEYEPDDIGTHRRWIVPIGSVDEEGVVTQYHVGAISLSSDAQERPDFKIYLSGYDAAKRENKYSIAAGHIAANGLTATTDEEADIEPDTDYWCKVTYQLTGGTASLAAEIVDEQPTASSEANKIIWGVLIGGVGETGIRQSHLGAITISAPNRSLKVNGTELAKFLGTADANIETSSGTSLIGDTASSVEVSGKVKVTGVLDGSAATTCGIEFTSKSANGGDDGNPARVIADVKDRDPSESGWGAHTITVKGSDGEEQIVHFLGNDDFEVDNAGEDENDTPGYCNAISEDNFDVADDGSGGSQGGSGGGGGGGGGVSQDDAVDSNDISYTPCGDEGGDSGQPGW